MTRPDRLKPNTRALSRPLHIGTSGLPKAWCYMCKEAHLFEYPCDELSALRWYKRVATA